MIVARREERRKAKKIRKECIGDYSRERETERQRKRI